MPQTRSKSAPRRISPTSTNPITAVDKVLPNGDLYIGGLSTSHAPEGAGKYLWSDGCVYEGEWSKGKACGKGKLTWPSGATFEGEFRGGKMEGFGNFVGSDGGSYRGAWVGDVKCGYGEKR